MNIISDIIIEMLFDGLYYVNEDRVITIWNKAAERITGFKKEEAIGKKCSDNILRHVNKSGVELCLTEIEGLLNIAGAIR